VATRPTFDPLEPLVVALIDIRAGLEAQLRLLTAAQVCVEYRREHAACDALDNCAAYLDRILEMNQMIVAALLETAGATREAAAGSETA
jgi:hypothetical protein